MHQHRLAKEKTINKYGSILFEKFMQYRLTHYFIIAIIAISSYSPVITGDFVFDDQSLIRDNSYITELQSLSSYLSQEDGIVDSHDKGVFHTGYYRPLINLTYFIDYKIWGMKAYGFRITNLVLHLFVCFILYELLLILSGYRQAVFLAVLLFALHPVHTETVAMIVSRNNILATLFILISLYGYHSWWNRHKPLALAISLLAFVGAVFSKEFGLMTLPVFFCYQRFLVREKNLTREIKSYSPYLFIMFIYLALRQTVVHTPLGFPDDILLRFAYIPYLIAYNLKLIFLPHNLHSFAVFYPSSLLTEAVIFSYLMILCLAGLLYKLRKEPLVVFAVVAFLVTLIPVLNLINKASLSLIAMRWLYLPMAFLSLSVAFLLRKIKEKQSSIKGIIFAAIALYFFAYTYTLNDNLWYDQETFLTQEVLHFDNNLFMGDYAEMMLTKKQYLQSEYFFERAVKKTPYIARDFINYGALLIETKRPQEALVILKKARTFTMGNKDRKDWYNNMGAASTLIESYDLAREYYYNALALNPQDETVNRNLAFLLFKQGRTQESAQHLKIVDSLERNKKK
jgi:tetratricopeptide (TPR) repeat protein